MKKLLLALPLLFSAQAGATSQPDVLVILLDDVGRIDLDSIPTPNLDAFPDVRFTRAYSMPLCSQSRQSLLFGRYFARNAGSAFEVGPDTPDPSWYSMGDLFKSAGYTTGMFGKWHLGAHDPSEFGFDTWRAGRRSNFGAGDYYDWTRMDDGVETQTAEYAGEADLLVLLDWWNSTPSPKFAYWGVPQSHGPRHAPPRHLLPWGVPVPTTDRQKHEQMVMAFDFLFGLLPNADVVVMVGDNGSAKRVGGQKKEVLELGVNVPMFVKGMRVFGETDRLVHLVDLLPTLGRLSGAPLPPTSVLHELDGRDMVTGPGRSYVYVEVDHPTNPFKQAAIEDRWKLVRKAGWDTLYDLGADPLEASPIYPPLFPVAYARLADVIEAEE